MCGYDCCIYAKHMNYSLLIWHNRRLRQFKYRSHNAQNRRSGEISSHMSETYKNTVQPNGCHIYSTSADMAMATMCTCNFKHRGIHH